ncbi:hypothetical protein ACHHYP_14188 [Achlya hypogyna]|uniref:Stress-response A/B barrel domain-containing protein n=1 Tax=Achlya hypogyna TaxID=1202772 RepID=A0A1V9YDR9_ACHHY|nr:hypothetical protein ACHHYP_14188 [Achlya hypogyna]
MEHIVLLKFKPQVTADTIAAFGQEILHLQEVVPGIIDMAWGENKNTQHGKEYTHALVARMENFDVLQAYEVHPDHVAVVKQFPSLVADFLIIDFTSPRVAPLRSRV